MITSDYEYELNVTLDNIHTELSEAKLVHTKNFNSVHEGYAVILEEIDELWDEVKKKHPSTENLRKEAIQAAAMLCRFIIELT